MATINIPQIRFKGFEGEWEKKIFEDICTFGNGYTPSKAIDEYWENGTLPWYRMEDIRENGRILKDSIQHITPKAVKGKLFPANSIIMSTTATIGEHALLIADSLANQRFTFFIKNVNRYNYDDLFFFYKCYSIGEWCKKNANAGGLLAVNMPELKKLGLSFPTSISEQTRIASLFTAIDKQISTSEAKLDKLRTIKKTLLKKMFAAQGELTPQIRFKGFDGEWENCLIESVCEISTGKSNTQDKNDEGIYPFYVRSSIIERSDKYLYDEVAVLTAGDGVGTGKIYHYVNGKYNLHQRCYRMFNFKHLDSKFFFYVFSTKFYKRVMAMTAKSSVDSVRYDMIAKMNIQLPQNKNEQTKIANLLTSADKQISLQEQKIEKLKAVKKTLLKKMFV